LRFPVAGASRTLIVFSSVATVHYHSPDVAGEHFQISFEVGSSPSFAFSC
jgi:hypothetical protein